MNYNRNKKEKNHPPQTVTKIIIEYSQKTWIFGQVFQDCQEAVPNSFFTSSERFKCTVEGWADRV